VDLTFVFVVVVAVAVVLPLFRERKCYLERGETRKECLLNIQNNSKKTQTTKAFITLKLTFSISLKIYVLFSSL